MVLTPRQSHPLQQLPRAGGRGRITPQLQGNLDVLLSRESWNQLKRLKDKTDFLHPESRASILGQLPDVLAVEMNGAAGWAVKAGEQPQERCLATARWTENRDEPARLETEADILQNREISTSRSIGPTDSVAVKYYARHSQ